MGLVGRVEGKWKAGRLGRCEGREEGKAGEGRDAKGLEGGGAGLIGVRMGAAGLGELARGFRMWMGRGPLCVHDTLMTLDSMEWTWIYAGSFMDSL